MLNSRRIASAVVVGLTVAACGQDGPSADVPDPGDAGVLVGSADALPTDSGVPEGPGPDATPTDATTAVDAGLMDAGLLPSGQVRVAGGIIEGVAEGRVFAFKGVPYAAAPIGDHRFRPPHPAEPWTDVRVADTFGSVCPQRDRQGRSVGDEDCLHLNVWGHLDAQDPKPVMVWIHGGGFIQGSSSVSLYDGARLADEGDVVVVTINYRLGALGFLALPELIAESDLGTAGNYGILDQIAALEWIRDNIAGFGGAPDRITIFGESAGGSSVCVLLATPRASGLFHRAAIQSGGGCFSLPTLDGAGGQSALDIGAAYATATGCDDAPDRLRCLRQLSASETVAALFNIPSSGLGLPDIGPAVDEVLLPEQAFDAFSRGAGNRVPLLLGSNRDEMVTFNAAIMVPDRDTFERLVAGVVGPVIGESVVELYPEVDYPVAKDAYNTLSSDLAFNCSAEAFARAASGGASDVFLYHFEQELEGPLGAQGVLHGQEIGFVFGTLSRVAAYRANDNDAVLSSAMLGAWASFAHTGVPSIDAPSWPAYDRDTPAFMNLNTPRVVEDRYRNGRCEALRALRIFPEP